VDTCGKGEARSALKSFKKIGKARPVKRGKTDRDLPRAVAVLLQGDKKSTLSHEKVSGRERRERRLRFRSCLQVWRKEGIRLPGKNFTRDKGRFMRKKGGKKKEKERRRRPGGSYLRD